jgi:hypothetical protein
MKALIHTSPYDSAKTAKALLLACLFLSLFLYASTATAAYTWPDSPCKVFLVTSNEPYTDGISGPTRTQYPTLNWETGGYSWVNTSSGFVYSYMAKIEGWYWSGTAWVRKSIYNLPYPSFVKDTILDGATDSSEWDITTAECKGRCAQIAENTEPGFFLVPGQNTEIGIDFCINECEVHGTEPYGRPFFDEDEQRYVTIYQGDYTGNDCTEPDPTMLGECNVLSDDCIQMCGGETEIQSFSCSEEEWYSEDGSIESHFLKSTGCYCMDMEVPDDYEGTAPLEPSAQPPEVEIISPAAGFASGSTNSDNDYLDAIEQNNQAMVSQQGQTNGLLAWIGDNISKIVKNTGITAINSGKSNSSDVNVDVDLPDDITISEVTTPLPDDNVYDSEYTEFEELGEDEGILASFNSWYQSGIPFSNMFDNTALVVSGSNPVVSATIYGSEFVSDVSQYQTILHFAGLVIMFLSTVTSIFIIIGR